MADSINYQLAHFVASYGKASQIPPSTCPEVSFVGRSNVPGQGVEHAGKDKQCQLL